MSAHLGFSRSDLTDTDGCQFVDASEFLALAVSSRSLRRADNVAAGLRGLFNPVTGEKFVIEEAELFSRNRSRQSE